MKSKKSVIKLKSTKNKIFTYHKKKIAFAGPSITKKEIAYVKDGVVNGFYENFNQHTIKLERAVSKYVCRKYAIATHCCTLALHLACETLGLKKGDEVICTDLSWVATAYAIFYTGATPVFVDVDENNWCISPESIEKAITPKTKAIMLVHMFGLPAQMDKIMSIAEKYHLAVIEDAAPSLGTKFRGKPVGSFGDIGCFSFQGAKIAVSGEGGIFVTDRKDLYDKALLFVNMGRTDSQAVFWSDSLGYQYTIANLAASLALAQVERIEELIAKKRQIYKWYEKRLINIPGLKLLKENPLDRSNYSYPSLFLGQEIKTERDEIIRILKSYNIHPRPAFPRMSLFPVFDKKPRFDNPKATLIQKRGMNLPSALNLTEKNIDFVCQILLSSIKYN